MKEAHIKHIPTGATLQFAWSMVRADKPMLFSMMFCACAFAILELIIPAVGKHLFDNMAIATPTTTAEVWHLAKVFFALICAFWVFRYAMHFLWVPFTARYIRRLVEIGFDRVQSFSTAWHNDTFAGVTVRNITRGMWALDGLLEIVITQFLPTFLIIIGAAAYMMATGHVDLGAYLLIFLIVFTGATGTISLKAVAPRNRASNEADSKLGGLLADAISCNAAIKAFGSEKAEAARIHAHMHIWRRLKMSAWYTGMFNGILQTTLIVGMRAIFVFSIIHQWTLGRASLGDVFYFFSITAMIQGYLRDFGMQLRTLQNHVNDLDPVAAYMLMTPSIVDAPDAKTLAATKGEVVLDNVTFGYKQGLPPLFQNLLVTLEAGKTVALVGRSGSGKTSFVKLVQRLYDVQGGRILIDGQDIAQVTQESLHNALALVPQEPVLFHRSLADNISYARPSASMDEVHAAARDAFIDDFIMGLPEKYETLVGERGVKLSGGERQRVAIARAILANRPVLVMDEATSSLDSVSETLIQKALEKLMAARTTIVIAHRLSTIRKADRILVFESGRIVEEGTHDSLLAKNAGVYKELYDAQVDGLIV